MAIQRYIDEDYIKGEYGMNDWNTDKPDYWIGRGSTRIRKLITLDDWDETLAGLDPFFLNDPIGLAKAISAIQESTAIYTDHYWKNNFDFNNQTNTTTIEGQTYTEIKTYTGEVMIPEVYELLQDAGLLETNEHIFIGVSSNTGLRDVEPTTTTGGSPLQEQVDLNTQGVIDNRADIATNTAGILANGINIATNVVDISNNTDAIAVNAVDIATNVSNIAQNTSNISAIVSAVATTTITFSPALPVVFSGATGTATYNGGEDFSAFITGDSVIVRTKDTVELIQNKSTDTFNDGIPSEATFFHDGDTTLETTLTSIIFGDVSNANRTNKEVISIENVEAGNISLTEYAKRDLELVEDIAIGATGNVQYSNFDILVFSNNSNQFSPQIQLPAIISAPKSVRWNYSSGVVFISFASITQEINNTTGFALKVYRRKS